MIEIALRSAHAGRGQHYAAVGLHADVLQHKRYLSQVRLQTYRHSQARLQNAL